MHAKTNEGNVRGGTTEGTRLLRVAEVAARFGVSSRQVWKLLASGRLPAPVRLGRSVRWRESDVARFIELGCPSRREFDEARGAGAMQ